MGEIHTLTRSNVNQTVPPRKGYYKLYKTREGPVRYVGSSKDLEQRLKQQASKDEYSYFEFGYESTIGQAYKTESRLYHRYGSSQLDNEKHPPRPNKRVKCPECDIHD